MKQYKLIEMLEEALKLGSLRLAKYLVEDGADIKGYSNALLKNIIYNRRFGKTSYYKYKKDIIEYLVENGADIQVLSLSLYKTQRK